MNLSDAYAEAQRLNRLLDAGVEAIRSQAVALAEAENAYRKARAVAWTQVPKDGSKEWPASRREAEVDAQTADLRQTRDIAEGVQRAAIEAVRARRQQLSTLQTFVAAERSEMELAR
jgi:hypothetical protein